MTKAEVREARTPDDIQTVQTLCWEYRDFLVGFDEGMRKIVEVFYPEEIYGELMSDLPRLHARPKGSLYLAEVDGTAVGCGMSHPLNDEDCEIKRVFVRDAARGSGAGEAISRALLAQARADGYRRILLDTNAGFTAARKLYEKLGFKSRGPYSETPEHVVPYMAFYELKL